MSGMTSSDFNCRINLQAFCDNNGVKDQTFIKMPRFGWFAISNTDGQIRTLIDFLPLDDIVPFCTDLIVEKPQYHEGRIFYNEIAVARLCNDIRIQLTLKKMHQDLMLAFREGEVRTDGKKGSLLKMFAENGMAAFAETGVGYMTEAIFSTYARSLALPRYVKNKLVIPTWYSPVHFSSLETAGISTPLQRHTFYLNGEKGWYGKPEKMIYGNLANLLTHEGCTWDRKLDYWVNKPIGIHEQMPVNLCIQIWTQAQNIRFKQDPLDIIEGAKEQGKLKHNLDGLNYKQLSELEKRFGLKLESFWRAQKQAYVTIGNIKFIARDMRYYVEGHDGQLQEFTNFSIEINSIKRNRTNGRFYRIGIVSYEGKQEPFELLNDHFLNVGLFTRAINEFFLTKGLGIPIISNAYRGYILEVINRLNANCMIDPVG